MTQQSSHISRVEVVADEKGPLDAPSINGSSSSKAISSSSAFEGSHGVATRLFGVKAGRVNPGYLPVRNKAPEGAKM